MEQAQKGVWTPWAHVICIDCHGPRFNRGFGDVAVLSNDEMNERMKAVDLKEGNGITVCGKCGTAIQVDSSLAVEHNLVIQLEQHGIDASMAQTGGMCSASEITKADGGYYLVTYNFDGEGGYYMGSYDGEGEWDDGDEFSTDVESELIEHILALDNVKRIEVGA